MSLRHNRAHPAGFGALTALVKLQASYNPLTSLPPDMWQLPSLELFRLAVGRLPQWRHDLLQQGEGIGACARRAQPTRRAS
jgi:hypothetical protein